MLPFMKVVYEPVLLTGTVVGQTAAQFVAFSPLLLPK